MVVPVEKEVQLSDQRDALKGSQNQASALNLHGLNESLKDCDASVFAYGSETLRDSSRPTPVFHLTAGELSFLIGDEILRFRADQKDDAIEQGDDDPRIGPALKHLKPLYATREMVQNNSNPPAERPAWKHCEWAPRGPKP